MIDKTTIPIIQREDRFIWNHSHDGDLSFKEAYLYHCTPDQNVDWNKQVWHASIPPSKSIMVWRCLHHKLPADDNLRLRGCHIHSMCSLCYVDMETTEHLLFHCTFAMSIWNWLGGTLKIHCNFSNVTEALNISRRNMSPLCRLVIMSAVINCINVIWFSRNQRMFADKFITLRSAINLVIAETCLAGNQSKLHAYSSIDEFVLLKAFPVKIN